MIEMKKTSFNYHETIDNRWNAYDVSGAEVYGYGGDNFVRSSVRLRGGQYHCCT